MIRLWGRQEESGQIDSRVPAVEAVWCKRRAGKGFMVNDTVREVEFVGRAWAGHSGDRGSC